MQGLIAESILQGNLFLPDYDPSRQQRLMETIDRLNEKWGKDTLFWGLSGSKKPRSTHRKFLSPRYTTCWSELPIVKAGFT